MRVVEIFESIDGEGIFTGCPATFIRLYGCNLHCSYCDSRYACEGGEFTEMTIEEVLDKVKGFDHKHVTLTGGEPLIHTGVLQLIQALMRAKFYVNVETDGAVDIFPYRITCNPRNLIFTLDYKCPSSGMEDRMILSNLKLLREQDVLKFVVGSQEDLEAANNIIHKYQLQGYCNIFISPVFGKIEPVEIVNYILKNHLEGVRVQLQMHKFIWNPDERGV